MTRFRPNIVVNTNTPFEEDEWRIIRISGVVYHVLKGCPRCKQACTDQDTGSVTEEPGFTLASFRKMSKRNPQDFYFGQNVATTNTEGKVEVGDVVEVIKIGRGGVWDKDTVKAE